MTRQTDMIATILAERPRDEVRGWLDRLAAALASETSLEPGTVADMVNRGRPRWGVSSADAAAAYVEFWSELTARHDSPALRAGYADVLYLLGPRERAREALDAFLAAAHRDPEVFILYSADFGDLATKLDARKEFELAKIAYYAHCVDQGCMDEADLRDSVRELLAEYPDDPELRSRLRAIAHRSLSA